MAVAPLPVLGQTPSAPFGTTSQSSPREPIPSEAQIVEAFGRRDYNEALRLVDRALKADPRDSYLHYNRACALALMGRTDDAAAALMDAVRNGFRDFAHMQRDPDLESLHEHDTYRAILEAKRRVDQDSATAQLQEWKRTFGEKGYRYETDEKHRLLFATALDETSHAATLAMLERQSDEMARSLFGGPPDYFVLIVVPTTKDAQAFFRELGQRDATFDSPNVAGIYEHRFRRLVSTDTGASLRHEFAHVMHYGHMERLGQSHPLWIQEGLASLYEEYRPGPNGTFEFLPNERHNVIRTLVRGGRAMKWEELFRLPAERFMERAQALYPEVRSVFEFLAARGVLADWYRNYVASFERSPSGTEAFETTFGKPIGEIERAWRAWVASSARVDREVSTGDASLGIAVEDENDGARVTQVMRGSAAALAGIRRGDVIVAVGDRTTPSAAELTAAVAARRIGDQVEVRFRRRGEYHSVQATLRPLPASPVLAQ
ncbi:MAG: PDZ domain-containing protein [Phycisphaerales bacterium]|nr:PDZ domain-containing protein [Phycisphaerales bacterium]